MGTSDGLIRAGRPGCRRGASTPRAGLIILQPRQACLLMHRGQGTPHLDLVIENGAACPTLRLEGRRWRWQAAHRRRYLGWSGPLSDNRGTVLVLWRGPVRLHRHNLGWLLHLEDRTLLLRRDGVVLPHGVTHSRTWRLKIPG